MCARAPLAMSAAAHSRRCFSSSGARSSSRRARTVCHVRCSSTAPHCRARHCQRRPAVRDRDPRNAAALGAAVVGVPGGVPVVHRGGAGRVVPRPDEAAIPVVLHAPGTPDAALLPLIRLGPPRELQPRLAQGRSAAILDRHPVRHHVHMVARPRLSPECCGFDVVLMCGTRSPDSGNSSLSEARLMPSCCRCRPPVPAFTNTF